MQTFIIIFVIAILFVVGSAGMMKYFDKKHAIKKEETEDQQDTKD